MIQNLHGSFDYTTEMKSTMLRAAIVVAGGLVTVYGFWSGARHMSDFAGYYTSARILVTDDSVSHMYDDAWFVNRMHRYGIPDSTLIMYVNPPPVAVVMTPLAWMPPVGAKIAWNAIGAVLLLVMFTVLRRLFNSPQDAFTTTLMAAIFFCTLPFLRNLQRGQLYILMLALLVLFVRGYLTDKPLLASVSLALLLLLKFFGWMFLLLFLAERRWKELGATALFVIVGTLIGLFVFGVDTYRAHIEVLGAAMARADFAFTGLPCVPALFGSLFTFHPLWNVNPVGDLPLLSSLLTAGSLAAMLIVTFARTPHNDMTRLSAIAILSVIFTPLAADHHYILLFLPASYILVNTDFRQPDRRELVLLVIVLILVLGWYPQPKMSMLAGLTKVFAFPRLYATVLLWSLLLRRNGRPNPARPDGGTRHHIHDHLP